MQIVTVEILNQKAIKLLQDLELLQLIRLRKEKTGPLEQKIWMEKYKGGMSKQSTFDIDQQINDLRNGWE